MSQPSLRFVLLVILPLAAACLVATLPTPIRGEEFALHSFDRKQLTDVYYSEGVAAGDLNRDGHVDVVYGPYWMWNEPLGCRIKKYGNGCGNGC